MHRLVEDGVGALYEYIYQHFDHLLLAAKAILLINAVSDSNSEAIAFPRTSGISCLTSLGVLLRRLSAAMKSFYKVFSWTREHAVFRPSCMSPLRCVVMASKALSCSTVTARGVHGTPARETPWYQSCTSAAARSIWQRGSDRRQCQRQGAGKRASDRHYPQGLGVIVAVRSGRRRQRG